MKGAPYVQNLSPSVFPSLSPSGSMRKSEAAAPDIEVSYSLCLLSRLNISFTTTQDKRVAVSGAMGFCTSAPGRLFPSVSLSLSQFM